MISLIRSVSRRIFRAAEANRFSSAYFHISPVWPLSAISCLQVSDSILLRDLLDFLFAFFGEAEAFVAGAVDDESLFAEFVEGVPVVGLPGTLNRFSCLSCCLLSYCLRVFVFFTFDVSGDN